jgi:hypothetical protein
VDNRNDCTNLCMRCNDWCLTMYIPKQNDNLPRPHR